MSSIKVLAFVLLAMFIGKVSAQGKYGKDSIDCVTNLNLYNTEYKSKNYKAALPYWREAIRFCPPAASQNMYIAGSSMMRDLIGKTSDPSLKEARIDTLMMMYDIRIQNFKVNKADLLYRKAADYEKFHPENVEKVYELYAAAVEVNKANCELHAAAKAMLLAKNLFESNKMDVEKFTGAYTNFAEVAEAQCKANPNDTIRATYKMAIEGTFLSTSAADCDNLVKVFGERFRANKDKIEVVRVVVGQLSSRECTQNELYYDAVEAYNKLDPSSGASYGLAKMYYAKGDKEKAVEYFKAATSTETDNTLKSKYYQEFGSLYLKEGNVSQAAQYAKQAIAANSRNGRAYLLLGTAYASVKGCGSDDVSKRSVYWAAVDQFIKAKQMDPSLADDANKNINLYSQHFPKKADAFFLDILDGNSYTVSCGIINEKTIVRTNK